MLLFSLSSRPDAVIGSFRHVFPATGALFTGRQIPQQPVIALSCAAAPGSSSQLPHVLSFQPAATLRAGQGLSVCIQGRNPRNTRAKGRSQTPATRPHLTARSAGGAGSSAKVKQQLLLGDRFARRLPCFWLPLFRGACYGDATADRVTLPSLPWLCDSSTPTLQVTEEETLFRRAL
ncbi:hypothetical protein BT67DRAFT_7082 [Trichocladium antarcticum]|uniref:Uncharacterized protein n=1 Tax=Trichocladium antarcticum TaxID=1450529 RepID=A0AAN6UTG6_9PEZI|nr:hypothetical protein BT67DRAFT_7082 [Trichocladium antarcticum]